jgi:hypothetical protein
MAYWVAGGEFRDTSFRELLRPEPPEGPFDAYDDALAAWRVRSIRRIDEAYVRYRIVRASDPEQALQQAADTGDAGDERPRAGDARRNARRSA